MGGGYHPPPGEALTADLCDPPKGARTSAPLWVRSQGSTMTQISPIHVCVLALYTGIAWRLGQGKYPRIEPSATMCPLSWPSLGASTMVLWLLPLNHFRKWGGFT